MQSLRDYYVAPKIEVLSESLGYCLMVDSNTEQYEGGNDPELIW